MVLGQRVAACVLGAGLFSFSVPGQIVYLDVTPTCGVQPQQNQDGMTSGVNAIDYDEDGSIDLFVPQAQGSPNQLYRNNGDGTFVDVASTLGLDLTEASRAALWLDYDADHDLDLLLFNDEPAAPTRLRLLRNDVSVFTDVTSASGLWLPVNLFHCGGMSAGDANNDGYLDVFLGSWGGPRYLYLNDGDGSFTDTTVAAGMGINEFIWQSMWYDFNQDGWQDLYVAIDDGPNELWINQQDGTFMENAQAAGLDNWMNDMGMTIGDYDNDGDFDIYVTNIYRNDPTFGYKNNVLLKNGSVGASLSFTEVSHQMGVEWGGWGWGTTFLDCDNDTLLDIAATNGFGAMDGSSSNGDDSRLYRNVNGVAPFQDVSVAANFDDTDWGSALVSLDIDNDGDRDLAQLCMSGPLRLLENDSASGSGNYLKVRPRMYGHNRFAIGGVVRVRVGSVEMARLITCGTSNQGQEPALAHFGLGAAQMVDEVVVEWPDGTSRTLLNAFVNQELVVIQVPPVCVGDVDGDGLTGVLDFAVMASHFGAQVAVGTLGDLDSSGAVDVLDFAILASDFGCPN